MDYYREATQKEIEMMDHLMKPKDIVGFWNDVHIFMSYLYENYPRDMKLLELEAQAERETAYNKWSSNKSKTQRAYGKLPDLLIRMLDTVYRGHYPISQNKFKREFFRRYPKFRVADVI